MGYSEIMLTAVDAWILDGIQRAANRMHVLTGFDSVSQGLAVILASMPCCAMGLLRQKDVVHAVWVAVWTSFVLWKVLWEYPDEQHALRSQGERGFGNRNRFIRSEIITRLTWLALAAMDLLVVTLPRRLGSTTSYWDCLFHFCVALHYYLRACDPKPPTRGTIREWLTRPALVMEPLPSREVLGLAGVNNLRR